MKVSTERMELLDRAAEMREDACQGRQWPMCKRIRCIPQEGKQWEICASLLYPPGYVDDNG